MHHQKIFMMEGMAVKLVDGTYTGRAYVGKDAVRFDLGCHILQVLVVPGRTHRGKYRGFGRERAGIPSYAESITIEGLIHFHRVVALLDDGVLRLVKQVIQNHRWTFIG